MISQWFGDDDGMGGGIIFIYGSLWYDDVVEAAEVIIATGKILLTPSDGGIVDRTIFTLTIIYYCQTAAEWSLLFVCRRRSA